MLPPIQDFLSDQVRARLDSCWPKPDPAAVVAAMDAVFEMADAAWEARRHSLDYLRTAPPAACASGCGWCCHQQLGVSVPEAVRLAAHLAALPADERAGFERRLIDTDRRTRGMTTSERARARVACAFLGADGRCMVYAVRPLRCRGVYSIDREFCIACYDDIDAMRQRLAHGQLKAVFLDVPARIYDSALAGVIDVLVRHARKAAVALEIVAAIRALVDDPSLGRRWLAGRAPDPALHLRPDPPEQTHQMTNL